ncbi:hypothetical protein GCM10023191_025480 [Actinoallomurus oryzae]|uniref:DNA-3-methyladenine glycosylase AlkA N-terminal domain-containing protein n=1 Tax=Actinoallomurus oryzae TaxID=502180 RepID=A0ABP8PT66_9ACTN
MDETLARAPQPPTGPALIDVTATAEAVIGRVHQSDSQELEPARSNIRRLLDPDAYPTVLDTDPALARLVTARPGLCSPGAADGFEISVRAITGQQISAPARPRSRIPERDNHNFQ